MKHTGSSKKVAGVPGGGEERFYETFNNVKDAIFIETPEGKILDVNKAACELLGYTREELLSMDVAGLVPPEIASHLSKTVRETTIEKGVYVESESLRKDGRRIPVEVSSTLVEIGGEQQVVAILRDISERKRAEAELKRYRDHLEELVSQRTAELVESENRLRKIFEFTKDAMFIEKPTGEILDVNKAGCTMLGYTKEELLTKDVAGLVPPELAGTLAKTIRQRTVQEGVYIETRDMRKDGMQVPVEVSCTLVSIKGEERVIAILRDISERKHAEKALRESEERFRKVFDNTKDAIFIEKPDGRFVDANKAAYAMLGYDREELLTLGIRDVVAPEVAPELPEDFTLEMPPEGIYSERENVRKDGARIYVEYGSSLVTIGGKKRMISIVRDITARKRAEEELSKYRDHLERMVQKRTAELARINKDLLAEIAKREKIQAELREKKSDLEKKNVALKEVLSQIEQDKEQIKSDVVANVEHLMIPILRKIKSKASRIEAKYIEMLRRGLEEMASSFGRKISDKAVKLSPREIEICDMIRNGMSSKEISELLHLTLKTVELQRVNIRRKLGLAHKDINLTTYLQSI
jgi:PAS domain S-box-containing protein